MQYEKREVLMDPITMLYVFGAATGITFLLLLIERTNWGRSKRAVLNVTILLALAAVGAYAWFVLKDMSIAAASIAGAWLGQTIAKLLEDFIVHFNQTRRLNKAVQSHLTDAGTEPVTFDVTPFRRNAVYSVANRWLKKGHEVGTVVDPEERVTFSIRARAPENPPSARGQRPNLAKPGSDRAGAQ